MIKKVLFMLATLACVFVLFLEVRYWDAIGPGVRVTVSRDTFWYCFVARGMVRVVILDAVGNASDRPAPTFSERFATLAPEAVRVLHVGLGVDCARRLVPMKGDFPPWPYGNPLFDSYDPSNNITVTTPGNIVANRYYAVPLWIPLALFTLPLAVKSKDCWRRRARRMRGCCLSCGYDLTGNVSGVCPECGEPIQ